MEPVNVQADLDLLAERFPGVTVAAIPAGGYEVKCSLENYLDVVRFLRERGFNYGSCITAIDWQDRLELVAQIYKLHPDYLGSPVVEVKVDGLPRQGAVVPSITPLYPGLNWHERETYDMYGIRFDGHPDLRRILLPDNWQGGHPLLKDFVDRRPQRPRLVRQRV
ncbi:NADH-quinone oxidoreductase subunit C [Caldinitratiruptor microaerophilus]|uniref:NADH-quinone oxidoreductase n=1 Tax=Caldinitratiruptor microaerophilus TaxID=671077 RepID=A0AA35G6F7_9FIRM|nr:NADH-quinone oxidoreductase subunit C [Caldinitratiruptor microaerophilus]BDG61231.1 NADH-quinone oxidoreductase subunit C [Caldinitratiruptor microaerophilus]